MCPAYAHATTSYNDEAADATTAPGNRDNPVDVNDFHVAHSCAHLGALRKTT